MSTRHPLLILGFWWGLAALIVLAGWCALPAERQAAVPTPTPTLVIIVLPTATVTPTAQPAGPAHVKPTRTPQPPIILNDPLPMTPSTRVPTSTPTPAPTETLVPPTPDKPAVQKG